MKNILFLFLLTSVAFSQSKNGFIFQKNTSKPIPFATVQIGNRGVISNEEGEFSIQTDNINEKDSLKISCIGFQTLAIPIKEWTKDTLFLEENVEELSEVFVMNKNLSPEEIMERVVQNIDKNYNSKNCEFSVFERHTDRFKMTDIDFDIKKANFMSEKELKDIQKSADSLAKAYKNKIIPSFSENFSHIAKGKDSKDVKWRIEKFVRLESKDKANDMEETLERTAKFFVSKLNPNSTYKVKTGLFKLADSLTVEKMLDEDTQEDTEQDSLKVSDHKGMDALIERLSLTIKNYSVIKDYKKYEFELLNIESIKGEMVYVLSFKPDRRSAKFAGKLYVSADTYAVLRLEYDYAEGKSNGLNLKFLLGIKFNQTQNKRLLLFEKTDSGYYFPTYMRIQSGQYVYLNRNIKIIEEHKGFFSKKDFSKIGVKVELDNSNTEEYLFVNHKTISEEDYNNFKENEGVPIEIIHNYDPKIWEAYPSLAPLREMREFGE